MINYSELGLPIFDVEFKRKSDTFIQRGTQGIVCAIVQDSKLEKNKIHEYRKFKDVMKDESKLDEKTKKLLKLIFKSDFRKLIVVSVADLNGDYESNEELQEALNTIKFIKWNYLVLPGLNKKNNESIVKFVEKYRDFYRPARAILANYTDSEGVGKKFIYNFTTDNVKSEGEVYSASEYTCRIAGILAGDRFSITGYELDDVTSADIKDNPDEAVKKGEIFIVTDGDDFSISRGITSLIKPGKDDIADFKKIRIVETADTIYEDIKVTWKKKFKGKYMGTYKNKLVFFAAVRNYLAALEKISILDDRGENKLEIDIEENERYLRELGKNVDEMTDAEIKEANTGSYLLAKGNLLIADALEDLKISFYL